MLGGATQAMPLCIVEERQQRRRPLAAAPLRAAARRAAGRSSRWLRCSLRTYRNGRNGYARRSRLASGNCGTQPWGPAAKCKCYSVTGPEFLPLLRSERPDLNQPRPRRPCAGVLTFDVPALMLREALPRLKSRVRIPFRPPPQPLQFEELKSRSRSVRESSPWFRCAQGRILSPKGC
jgi:hypothetical protein